MATVTRSRSTGMNHVTYSIDRVGAAHGSARGVDSLDHLLDLLDRARAEQAARVLRPDPRTPYLALLDALKKSA